jgi:hypothetical protein
MAADGSGAIGPVSARYAAQIRELLFAQAMQRMAADQEAARAQSQAERAARVEPDTKAGESRHPLPVGTTPEPAKASEATAEPKQVVPTAPAQLIDIQA